jgi:hypothetical protein
MKPDLTKTLKNRGFILSVHIGLWVLLYLSVSGLGGKSPSFRDTPSSTAPAQGLAPIAKLDRLFAAGQWPKALVDANTLNPFLTHYFIPPPTPAPPPPTTRKIELTYQGFYEIANGPKTTIVKLGEAFLVTPIGSKVTANLFAANANFQALTLTNPAAQTNILPLNTKKEIEVPIQ